MKYFLIHCHDNEACSEGFESLQDAYECAKNDFDWEDDTFQIIKGEVVVYTVYTEVKEVTKTKEVRK